MIAEQFSSSDIECLITTAVELWEEADITDLSGRQQAVLDRAREAVQAEYGDQAPAAPDVTAFVGSRPIGEAWVLRRRNPHTDEITLWADEASAVAFLAEHVRDNWHNVAGEDGIPSKPPAEDRQALDLYYRSADSDHCYTLNPAGISRRGRTRIVPANYRFPDDEACERANRAAVFHPQDEPDTLPCIETAGVQAYLYLDAEDEAVRVSIHLDTADNQIVRPDGTVPVHVAVAGTMILDLDDAQHLRSAGDILRELFEAATEKQVDAIRDAAIAAGILWRCPACQWDNPRTTARCDGPGRCDQAQPPTPG